MPVDQFIPFGSLYRTPIATDTGPAKFASLLTKLPMLESIVIAGGEYGAGQNLSIDKRLHDCGLNYLGLRMSSENIGRFHLVFNTHALTLTKDGITKFKNFSVSIEEQPKLFNGVSLTSRYTNFLEPGFAYIRNFDVKVQLTVGGQHRSDQHRNFIALMPNLESLTITDIGDPVRAHTVVGDDQRTMDVLGTICWSKLRTLKLYNFIIDDPPLTGFCDRHHKTVESLIFVKCCYQGVGHGGAFLNQIYDGLESKQYVQPAPSLRSLRVVRETGEFVRNDAEFEWPLALQVIGEKPRSFNLLIQAWTDREIDSVGGF